MALNSRSAIAGSSAADPAVGGLAINYGTDQVLPTTSRGIYISTAGALTCVMIDGSVVLFSGLVAGQVYPFAVKQINNAGSTAAGVVLL